MYTAGYEWRRPNLVFFALGETGVCGNEEASESHYLKTTGILVHLAYINRMVCRTSYAHSLLMGAS